MKYLLEANNISVNRQGKQILDNVSLRVSGGDFLTIIGPNGAGKSMLLKCLMGIFPPDTGTIKREDGLKIGYVPQRFQPDYSMPISVRRFIMLRKKVDRSAIEEVALETGINEILGKPLVSLSGGEMQGVLLARSLLNDPDILVLDEPAQNLDISGQLGFYRLVEHIYKERNIGILMVSHDLHMVMASTKEVVCLFHHICCSGEPQTVTKDPEFISLFGNDMANMMAAYQHTHDHTHKGNQDS